MPLEIAALLLFCLFVFLGGLSLFLLIYTILMVINAADREDWPWVAILAIGLLVGYAIIATPIYRFTAYEPKR